MPAQRRSDLEVIVDIIRASRRSRQKTAIFRFANVNHLRGNQYLQACCESGFLVVKNGTYSVTPEGETFLGLWRRIEDSFQGVREQLCDESMENGGLAVSQLQ